MNLRNITEDPISQTENGYITPGECETNESPCCEEDALAQLKFNTDTFRIMKVGWFTALALTLHNIPEVHLSVIYFFSTIVPKKRDFKLSINKF